MDRPVTIHGVTLPAWAGDILAALDPILTRAGAAQALTLSERQLDRLASARVIRMVPQGTRRTFPRLAIVDYLLRRVGLSLRVE